MLVPYQRCSIQIFSPCNLILIIEKLLKVSVGDGLGAMREGRRKNNYDLTGEERSDEAIVIKMERKREI